jgi:NAD(P)-dependent dehydrogenase (short-subunit alcohol dehydrogenase family)
MSMNWGTSDIPDLTDKVAIVTGGNIGLGYQTSLELARRGASVIIACRSLEKGSSAAGRIHKEIPQVNLEIIRLDLLAFW